MIALGFTEYPQQGLGDDTSLTLKYYITLNIIANTESGFHHTSEVTEYYSMC